VRDRRTGCTYPAAVVAVLHPLAVKYIQWMSGRCEYTREYFQGRSSPHSPLVELFNNSISVKWPCKVHYAVVPVLSDVQCSPMLTLD
jgi:hypothetical protein